MYYQTNNALLIIEFVCWYNIVVYYVAHFSLVRTLRSIKGICYSSNFILLLLCGFPLSPLSIAVAQSTTPHQLISSLLQYPHFLASRVFLGWVKAVLSEQ